MSSTESGPLADADIGEIILYVENLAAMKEFYADVLGLSITRENPALVTLAGAAGAELVLHQGRPEGACEQTHSFIQFLVKDIHASVAGLVSQGIESAVEERPYGTYARFRDPEGNLVGIEQSR